MRILLQGCIALLASLPVLINAYELETHGAITREAYTRSELKVDPNLIQDLGIETMADSLGDVYYDSDRCLLRFPIVKLGTLY
ncbi:hypothetical protein MNBD_GAMMA22-1502 [hydrothermal vent metagenome]|uniref:Uncharacterized protein n=1 Tax=hydrothermal vent metagenome TaxID=652676 RepID=A0A3B1ACJ4_9ZZZZ